MISPKSVKFAVRAAALVAAALLHSAAHADVVLLGSDYFQTIQPTFYTPLDGIGMGVLNPLTGLPMPKLADKDNHVIDALRYACEGARRAIKARPVKKSSSQAASSWMGA